MLAPLTMKPKVVDAFPATEPLYEAFLTVTAPLVPVLVPLQMVLRVCPLARVKWTVHPLSVVEPLFATVTSPSNPPGHPLTVR